MFEIDKNRVLNESPKKVLIREYNNLINDYTKRNAFSYKLLYENASLSFILENSQYIFTEPMKGCDFYKNVIEKSTIPFHLMEMECDKVSDYIEEKLDNMSDFQKNLYINLKESVDTKYENMKNSIHLYTSIMKDVDSVVPYYDVLYEYTKDPKKEFIDELDTFFIEFDSINLMDSINIFSSVPELYTNLLGYIEKSYIGDPFDPDDYELNNYTINVIKRMMKDSYIKEKVSSISNMNLRHTIMGLSGINDVDSIIELTTETTDDISLSEYTEASNVINDIYEDIALQPILEEENDEEKVIRLICEKSVVDMDLAFALVDSYYDDICDNSIIEKALADSNISVPTNAIEQTKLLQEMSDNLKNEILLICEKYFTPEGSPSSIVARSTGAPGTDERMTKQKDNKENSNDNYTPYQLSDELDDDKNDNKEKSDAEGTKKSEKLDDDKRSKKKDAKMNKYADMSIDEIDFDESTFEDMLNIDYFKEDEDDPIPELSPPQKRNIFQRIQNKAIDTNVKFKKKVANAKRKRVDARNAAKASASIPKSVTSSIKRTVDDWDEMDDNRRKEYMIKPGFRKKYFRALKLCIVHYGAFAINPVLNIVLLICQRAGKSKDKRIKNELIRELRAEIDVTNEKIEDAKSNGDNKQKYQLMRINEKLKAEVVRLEANSKYV